ncbi:MAG: DUF2214 family protein [Pseudohongiellaceae bacterium]
MLYTLLRTLHLFGIVALIGAIVIENIGIKPIINREDAVNLAKVDKIAGLSAVITLFLGLVLWFAVGKPASFYTDNPVFHGKVGLFGLLCVMAVFPALFFLKHANTTSDAISVPKLLRWILKCELFVIFTIPIFAFLMARGIGLSG